MATLLLAAGMGASPGRRCAQKCRDTACDRAMGRSHLHCGTASRANPSQANRFLPAGGIHLT